MPQSFDEAKFAKSVLSELERRFVELYRSGAVEKVDDRYVQANVPLTFRVRAGKGMDIPDDFPHEVCCICWKQTLESGEEITVCTGECCP